jgi:hypothetical protein
MSQDGVCGISIDDERLLCWGPEVFFEDLQNTTLFEASLIMPAPFNRTKDMDNHAIWSGDDMILKKMHSFPSIIYQPLVTRWVSDFFKSSVHERADMMARCAFCRYAVGKLFEGMWCETSWIEVQEMFPAVVDVLCNKSSDSRKVCGLPAILHLDTTQSGRGCQALE